jgi:hypothetical protein
LPFFCAAIIILGGIARPFLVERETRLLKQDTLIVAGVDTAGVTTIEGQLTQRLRGEFAAALAAEKPLW